MCVRSSPPVTFLRFQAVLWDSDNEGANDEENHWFSGLELDHSQPWDQTATRQRKSYCKDGKNDPNDNNDCTKDF